ncbi:MAG: carbohydrate-binding domain-containing protein [Muribaculaceae bacterium]
MKTRTIMLVGASALVATVLTVNAVDDSMLWFATTGGDRLGLLATETDSIRNDGLETITVVTKAKVETTLSRGILADMTFGEPMSERVVEIAYQGDDATVTNPYAFAGVDISKSGGDVVVTSVIASPVTYRLSGIATAGSFKIYSDADYTLELNGVVLANDDGAAINMQSKAAATISVSGDVQLDDAATYNTPAGEKEKGAVYCRSNMIFTGSGSLTVTANKKSALVAEGDVTLAGPAVSVVVTADSGKGISAAGNVTISGGSFTATCSGNVEVEDGDTSYCTAIKADGDFVMDGGRLSVSHSGIAGKGVSADGNISFYSPAVVNISVSGNGGTYTNADGEADAYSSTCITGDVDITLAGGSFTLSSSGTAGKCVKADGAIYIGESAEAGPDITAGTTGARILVSGSTSQGGGRPGGGGSTSADYSNPKVIAAEAALTVNGGTLHLSSTQDGGEGLESKTTLTINGGDIDIHTVDDCINAASHIQINGGRTACIATGNDAVDSNGTITIAGGTLVACGASGAEGGIDCDQNKFAITGGLVIGLGGSNSSATATACTQHVVSLSASSLTSTSVLTLTDSEGHPLLSFACPASYGTRAAMLLSMPDFVNGASFRLYKSGYITGGDTFADILTTGSSEYVPGTQISSFTISTAMTQSVN